MKDVTDKHVPISKPVTFCVLWWFDEIVEIVKEARRSFRRHRKNLFELARHESPSAKMVKRAAIRQAKKQCFKEANKNLCKKGE